MFENRAAAGRALGERLADRVTPDVVLAVPDDGVRVARPIADRIGVPVGVIAAEPIRTDAPQSLPLGAVTDTGHAWIDDEFVDTLDIDRVWLDAETQRAFRDARRTHETHDEVDEDPTPEGTVAVVDDGVVSGTAMKACVSALDRVDACSVVVAVAPFGAPRTVAELHTLADEVVVSETTSPRHLHEAFYAAADGADPAP